VRDYEENMQQQSVGVDLGGTKLLMVCDDQMHRVRTGPAFSPQDLEAHIREFIATLHTAPTAIGIALPGLVRDAECVVSCDVLPKMTGWCAVSALAETGCRIVVVNDVKAALAEEMHDAPPGITAGIIMAGTAVGSAFITEGKSLLGASGWAGELGYMSMFSGGTVKRLDELAGGSFMAARRNAGTEEFVRLADAQDTMALQIIREGGIALGAAVATVINLLNPARLAVGGGAISLPGYWDATQDTALRYSIPEMWKDCRLYRVRDDPAIAARGAVRCVAG
jgi:predicted NBD/HSP70 family sugar kinase